MKALKVVSVVSMLVLFYVACGGNETGNGNAGGNSNAGRAAGPLNANASVAATPVTGNANTGAAAAPANSNSSAAGAQTTQAAAELFTAQKCAGCHGPDGKGKIKAAPDFTSAEWQGKHSDAELTEGIKKGDPPKMPPYQDKLSDDQIKTLVAYVRSFAKK